MVCVVSCCASFRILFFFECNTSFVVHPHKTWRPPPPTKKPPTPLPHFPASVSVRWLRFICAFFLLLLFYSGVFMERTGISHLLYMQQWTVLRPNWFHFLISCIGLLLNISIYWYIKSDWKFLLPVLSWFSLRQNIKFYAILWYHYRTYYFLYQQWHKCVKESVAYNDKSIMNYFLRL